MKNKSSYIITKVAETDVADEHIFDMIVFCHLRWNFVYQRPQHIISRLSNNYNILVVEEPMYNEAEEGSELTLISPSLSVLKPNVPSIRDIHIILKNLGALKTSVVWLYSAAFVDVLPDLKYDTLVYDCMDELSQFKGASTQLKSQENYLIKEADLIFTGGKSLFEEKSKFSSNVHCFPSSVDVPHFKKASNAVGLPADIRDIPKPIVGYIGVIDERINLNLIEESAKAMPNVSFVMIGPLAKINENDLPREQNIYYLGMKRYEELPTYLNAFTIAMMPFALNEATQFISPTKTLEYMAAGKPIISTPIKDVVRDYSQVCHIVDSSEELIDAVHLILSTDENVTSRYGAILEKTSWDNTVKTMLNLLKSNAK